MTPEHTVKRALLSVSDKEGLVEFAQELQKLEIELISTGNTAKVLRQSGLAVKEVSEVTGFPEMLGGRVKSLHPHIHAAILAKRPHDLSTLTEFNIQAIDLVVVNLYPFAQTIADDSHTLADAIENIDIGGPTLIRAAAKNFHDVMVVVDRNDYASIIDQLNSSTEPTPQFKQKLATKAFAHTAHYDAQISNYFNRIAQSDDAPLPTTYSLQLNDGHQLRYGENPHQGAMLYKNSDAKVPGICHAQQLAGKELSYNNIADADSAINCLASLDHTQCCCVIVKHNTPCGVAQAATTTQAYKKAFATDPTSAFGGIIAFNKKLDETTAKTIIDQQFVEMIIAPEFTQTAIEILNQKPNIRLLALEQMTSTSLPMRFEIKSLSDGFLVQASDQKIITEQDLKLVTDTPLAREQIDDLLLAWQVAKSVKSNAIVMAKNHQIIGIGAGQPSRIAASRICIENAKHFGFDLSNAVLASDAFFPFADGVLTAIEAGVKAIIQPGGSMRDQEVIDACNQHLVAMVFTGVRHFKH